MNTPSIVFENVSKSFRRTYTADSLRDALAAPFRKFLGGRNGDRPIAADGKTFWALKDVSFRVHPGEVLGIIGPNGSGKSTTLKLLSRILRPDSGRIRVRGRVGALIELGAGFNPDLTGRENVFLNASILGMKRKEIERKYDRIVEFAELGEFMDTPVKWYSSGMFARLGFSVAAHLDPDVLLVDEVLSVGDVGFQRRCRDWMRRYRETGATVVFVSHNMSAVTSLCDRVAVLDRGKLLYVGSPGEAVKYYMETVLQRQESVSGPVRLVYSEVTNASGLPTRTFQPGEPCLIELALASEADLSGVNLGITIGTREGVTAFRTTVTALTGRPLRLKAGETVRVRLALNMNLGARTYDVTTWIEDPRIPKTLFQCRVAEIVMEKAFDAAGVSYLDPTLVSLEIERSLSGVR